MIIYYALIVREENTLLLILLHPQLVHAFPNVISAAMPVMAQPWGAQNSGQHSHAAHLSAAPAIAAELPVVSQSQVAQSIPSATDHTQGFSQVFFLSKQYLYSLGLTNSPFHLCAIATLHSKLQKA